MMRREFLATTVAAGVAYAAPRAKLRVGVIGHTGRGNYGHDVDKMWLGLPETEIVAIADPDAVGLAKAKERLKCEAGFGDYTVMLREAKPEIVAIGPRFIDQRRDMIVAAIEAGAKGVYIDKPFCRTPGEADEIAAAAKTHKTKIAVAHRNRWHPVLPVLAKMIEDGSIGRVLEMRGRGKEDARGGSLDLWVLGPHLMNLANFFGGKPLACSATVSLKGQPIVKADLKEGDEGVGPLAGDEVHARFEMEKGMPYFFDSLQKAGVAAAGFGLQVIGTLGIIDLRVDKEPLAQVLMGNPFQPVKEPRAWVPVSSAGVGKPEPVANLDKDLMAHLVGGQDLIAAIREDRATLCDVVPAAITIEMIAAVFESHRLNGQRVTLPLKTRENPLTLL